MIRDATPDEYAALGEMMIRVYSGLSGFPAPAEQPEYYRMLGDIGRLSEKHGTRVLVAIPPRSVIAGGVVYVGDMTHYGSGGSASSARNASGIRLLGVDRSAQCRGIGTALTRACINIARARLHSQVILHTTRAMSAAWRMYERLGFVRSEDLDFLQAGLPVFGFRLDLTAPEP